MKTIPLAFLLILFAVLNACGSDENTKNITKNPVEISSENLLTANYSIEGMECSVGCAAFIQKEVNGLDGVGVCKVDFETKKAYLEFDKSKLSEKEIISKIETLADGQYTVDKTEEKVEVEEITNAGGEDIDVEVPSFNFEIPNLFSLLIDRL